MKKAIENGNVGLHIPTNSQHFVKILGYRFDRSSVILFIFSIVITIFVSALQVEGFRLLLRAAVVTPIHAFRVAKVRFLRSEVVLLRAMHKDENTAPFLAGYFALKQLIYAVKYFVIAAVYALFAVFLLSTFVIGSFSFEAHALTDLERSARTGGMSLAYAWQHTSFIVSQIVAVLTGVFSGQVLTYLFRAYYSTRRGLDFLDGQNAVEAKQRSMRAVFDGRRSKSRLGKFMSRLRRSPRL